jgi:uncharacterized protein with gpF-like domain
MTVQNNSIAIPASDSSAEFEKMQSELIENWSGSIDCALNSFSQFLQTTGETMDVLCRHQSDYFNMFLSGYANPGAIVKTDKKIKRWQIRLRRLRWE